MKSFFRAPYPKNWTSLGSGLWSWPA
jgi:hypothetical protein